MNLRAAARSPARESKAFCMSSLAVAIDVCVSRLVATTESESRRSSVSSAASVVRRDTCSSRKRWETLSGSLGTSALYTKLTTGGGDTRPVRLPEGESMYRAQASEGVSPGKTTRWPSPASRKASAPTLPDCRMVSWIAAECGASARSRFLIATACSLGTSGWLAQPTTTTPRLRTSSNLRIVRSSDPGIAGAAAAPHTLTELYHFGGLWSLSRNSCSIPESCPDQRVAIRKVLGPVPPMVVQIRWWVVSVKSSPTHGE